MNVSRRLFPYLLALAAAFWIFAAASAEVKIDKTFGRPQITAVTDSVKVLPEGKVVDFGQVVYQGPIDVNPTLERIREGKKLDHRNDGAFFMNREKRLPVQRDRDYYREFVVWDPKFNAKLKVKAKFPGPQRVVIGKKGEVYYTGDHYNTWKRVR
jgi:guanyl-specific ribonuclease Sa